MKKKKKFDFGKVFFDSITKHSYKTFKINPNLVYKSDFQTHITTRSIVKSAPSNLSNWRLTFFWGSIVLVFFVFIGRLVNLQLIQGNNYKVQAEGNRIHVIPIHAPRGLIYDSKGELLAQNTAGFRLISGQKVQRINRDTALSLLAQNLVSEGGIEKELGRIEVDTQRRYPYPVETAHLLGYVGEISKDELESEKFVNYSLGDLIGRLGLEQNYERYLKGVDGRELVEIDALGKKLRQMGEETPIVGSSVYTSIDLSLQVKMYQALKKTVDEKNTTGVAIAQNPKTGEILGLVSLPSYDNDKLSNSISQADLEKVTKDPKQPFLNRVTSGSYPPGSIFKIVSSIAGLESGKINKDTQIEDTGEIFLGEFRFPNWYFIQYGRKEGVINLTRAIARSNDIFFYKVGEFVGNEVLADFAFKLGFGKKSGIDLPSEEEGLVPTEKWKQEVKGEPWFPGNTLHMAIGQGDVLATPLQLVNLTSFVANNGTAYKPHIVEKVISPQGKILVENKPEVLAKDISKRENLSIIQEGMRSACSTGGTGWTFFDFKIPVACKTGTAEFAPFDPHAWFTVYAPYDNPEIALTVLVEKAGEGSSVAGPVAREILDWYFR